MTTSTSVAATEPATLAAAPERVVMGFGMAMRSFSPYLVPRNAEELTQILQRAAREGVPLALRGTGNSYGDAALNSRRLVIDTSAMKRILQWDPQQGVVDVEPGVTICDLWHHTIADGYWPVVVPGTMAATLAGCAAMNIHGKNCYKVGPIGDQILEFDLLSPQGELLTCSREENAEVFHAAISGFGMLGAFTRIRLRMKRIQSGLIAVEGIRTRDLAENFAEFEARCPHPDYLVGWLDSTATGRGLGRGVLHEANYLPAEADPEGPEKTLRPERQGLPGSIMGFPRSQLWRFMRPFINNFGVRFVNSAKYHASRIPGPGEIYLQSHGEFNFLLDYVPDWRLSYGREGLIQYQPFVPREHAQEVFHDLIRLTHRSHLPPYLLVLKRHRPDPFLLTHAVDGYSLAMDFRVTRANRARLWKMGHEMTERVLAAGGRFYFAKDAMLSPDQVRRTWGAERIEKLHALKLRLDPQGLLQTDLSRRVFDW